MGGCCLDDDHDDQNVEEITMVTQKRSCTDSWCCIIYILFLGFTVFASIYGWSKGNLKNIAQPYDVDSNACGKGALKDFPYLYFNSFVYNPKKVTGSVCVKKCLNDPTQTYQCYPNSEIKTCSAISYYATKTFMERFCLAVITSTKTRRVLFDVDNLNYSPYWATDLVQINAKDLDKSILKAIHTSSLQAWFEDILDAWWPILIGVVLALVLSLLYIWLIKVAARCIIYTFIF